MREAVHWFLESLVGAGVSVIAAGRRDKGAPGTIHDRTGASSASGSVSQNLRVKDRWPFGPAMDLWTDFKKWDRP